MSKVDDITSSIVTVGGGFLDDIFPDTPGADIDPETKKQMIMLFQALMIVIVVLVIYYIWMPQGPAVKSCKKMLEKAGWMLYTREGCPWCHKQMEALGGSYKKHVLCPSTPAPSPADLAEAYKIFAKTIDGALLCGDPKITGYPFWFNSKTGESVVGYQDEEKLAMMCARIATGGSGKACPPINCDTCAAVCESCQ